MNECDDEEREKTVSKCVTAKEIRDEGRKAEGEISGRKLHAPS